MEGLYEYLNDTTWSVGSDSQGRKGDNQQAELLVSSQIGSAALIAAAPFVDYFEVDATAMR